MDRKEVLITDLAAAVTPQSAVNYDRYSEYQWRAVPYRTADFSGRLLMAMGAAKAPTLTLSPTLTGWYKIFVGLSTLPYGDIDEVQLRLTTDRVYTTLRPSSGDRSLIDEAFWKCADMTGQSITIGKPDFEVPRCTSIDLLRFVP